MPSVSLKRLTKVWQGESAGKTKQVLEACHRRKEGRSIRGTAREMGLAYSTVRDWLVRMHAGGLNRRFERRRADRKRTLTGAILKHIKRWLNGSPQTYGFEADSGRLTWFRRCSGNGLAYPAGCARSKGCRDGWDSRTASPGRSPTSLPPKQNRRNSSGRLQGC